MARGLKMLRITKLPNLCAKRSWLFSLAHTLPRDNLIFGSSCCGARVPILILGFSWDRSLRQKQWERAANLPFTFRTLTFHSLSAFSRTGRQMVEITPNPRYTLYANCTPWIHLRQRELLILLSALERRKRWAVALFFKRPPTLLLGAGDSATCFITWYHHKQDH